MNRRHITPATPRLQYNPQKSKSRSAKRNSDQPQRWRTAQAPSDPHLQAASRAQSPRYVIELIERQESSSFTPYSSPHAIAPLLVDAPPENSAVPPLARLCQRRITMNEKSYRGELAHLLGDDYLPTEIRNEINSAALAKGYLVTEREMKRLLLHADMEELDLSHVNCRELVTDAFMRNFFPHAPILQEIDSWEEITSADLYRSPQGCPRLLRLSLAGCWNISRQLIKDALMSFAHLSVLDLSYLPVDMVNGVHFESQTLTQLMLTRIRGTRPKFPLNFTLAAPSLRVLSLRDTPYVGAISSVPARIGSSKGRVVKRALVGDDAIACRLHALDMSGVHLFALQVEDNAPGSLLELCFHNAATLKVLNLAHCDVKPFLLERIRALTGPLPDLRLEEVSLASNKNLTSEGVVEFVRTFSASLRLLDISRCDVHAAYISATAHSLQPSVTVRT